MKARRIKIRGRQWRIEIGRAEFNKVAASCNWTARRIRISPNAIDPVGCLIHEVIHAAQPDLAEDAVEEIGNAIASALEAGLLVRS